MDRAFAWAVNAGSHDGQRMDLNKLDPVRVAVTCSAFTAIGAIAEYLLSQRPLKPRVVIATMLYGGLAGGGIGLCWYNYFFSTGNIIFLLGVSAFAGLGGMHFLKAIVKLAGTVLVGLWNGLKNVGTKTNDTSTD